MPIASSILRNGPITVGEFPFPIGSFPSIYASKENEQNTPKLEVEAAGTAQMAVWGVGTAIQMGTDVIAADFVLIVLFHPVRGIWDWNLPLSYD